MLRLVARRWLIIQLIIPIALLLAFFGTFSQAFYHPCQYPRDPSTGRMAKDVSSVPVDHGDDQSKAKQKDDKDDDAKKKNKPLTLLFHHLAVCMVPPDESSMEVWEYITKCRTELRDPGLFRWPPHANLLYPFVAIRNTANTNNTAATSSSSMDETTTNEKHQQDSTTATVDPEVLDGLVAACRQVEPFVVRLDSFGTFGGKKRGVLWLDPESRDSIDDDDDKSPLERLQAALVQQFPACTDQSKSGRFRGHMTVSHFASLEEAVAAQEQVEQWWPSTLQFPVNCIYLLERIGDDGQFLRVADVPLGSTTTVAKIILHDPPIPFSHMPTQEEEWVRQERFKMKERRRRNGRRRKSRGGSRRRRNDAPRIQDSPEVIAAKRAARKAKREAAASAATNNNDDSSANAS